MDLLTVSIAFGAILIAFIYFKLVNKYEYWNKKGIKGPKPTFILGNLGPFVFKQKCIGKIFQDIYLEYKKEKVVGIYKGLEPVALICDTDIIKNILIKDFNYFEDRGDVLAANSSLSSNIYSADGPIWRVLRPKISPAFSSGKLKAMFYLMQNCAENFEKYISELIETNANLDVGELAVKYTMEVVCICAFGVEVNGFKDDENIYRTIGRNFLNPSPIKFMFEHLAPKFAKLLNICTVSKETEKFFKIMVEKLIAERQGKLKSRHDFMDLMVELKEQGQVKGSKPKDNNEISLEINNNILEAQALMFFIGGFETSSSTMSFMLYEFAMNQEEQESARKEIDVICEKYGGFTFEAIQDMEYLAMCMDETLRKYPVGDILTRRCSETYYLPELNLTLEKGLHVMFSLFGIGYDSDIFSNPEKFDPERYSKENKAKYPYFAFGEGPRICIGKRFARLQTLLGIATLLRKYKVVRTNKTPEEIRFRTDVFLLESVDRIWVEFKKRKGSINETKPYL